jgi:hypothetical protein
LDLSPLTMSCHIQFPPHAAMKVQTEFESVTANIGSPLELALC